MKQATLVLKGIGYVIIFAAIVIGIKKGVIEPVFSRLFQKNNVKLYQGIANIGVQVGVMYVMCRYLIKQPMLQQMASGRFLLGMIAAGVLIGISIGILTWARIYQFETFDALTLRTIFTRFATAVVFFIVLALFEEIVFRGILFTVIREGFNQWVTIAIVTGFFAVLHVRNENISFQGMLSVILGGILLNLMREYSGDIAMPLGFHFVWNLVQGMLGFNISGDSETESLVLVNYNRDAFLSGGDFGPEASVITLILLVVAIIGMVLMISLKKTAS